MGYYSGTSGDDVFTGTSAEDTINGNGGNDTLNGDGGDDRIVGGAGNDAVNGGAGNDYIVVSGGADIVNGGSDTDTLEVYYRFAGTSGITVDLRNLWTGGVGLVAGGTVTSIEAVEQIETAGGNDTVFLGDYLGGEFSTYLGTGDDRATGGARVDRLYGGDGNDTLIGGGDDDYFDGGFGNDAIDGGAGNDHIYVVGGADTVNGGAGTDTIAIAIYLNAAGPITVDLRNLWTGGVGLLAGGTVTSIEAVAQMVTTRFSDTVFLGDYLGEAFNTSLDLGDDTATGGARVDRLYGGDGNDTLNGGGGDDYLAGQVGNDTLNGGDGDDYLAGEIGNDAIDGGAGNDRIYVNLGADTVSGGADTDTIEIYYRSAASGITVDLRNVWTGGTGLVAGGTVTSIEEVASIETTGYDDTVFLGDYLGAVFNTTLGGGHDTATGGARSDRLFGGSGNDILNGGGGDNYLDGGFDSDILVTGDGADELRGGEGNDMLTPGGGNDYLDGSIGTDIAVFSGVRATYLVYANAADRIFVRERAPGGSTDELYQVETLRFADGDYDAVSTVGRLGALIHVAGDGRESAYPQPIYEDLPVATNGNDNLTGTSGNDVVFAGTGEDTISTDVGDDRIEASGATVVDTDGTDGDAFAVVGGDAVFAGAGNDVIRAGYETSVDGGADIDQVFLDLKIAYEPWVTHSILSTFNYLGVDVDLGAADTGTVVLAIGGLGDLDITLTDVEQFDIIFGSGNDRVFGGALADRFDGDSYNFPGGEDELHGRGGNDRLYGGDASDILYGDEGDDELNGGAKADTMIGGLGDDRYLVDDSHDIVTELRNEGTDTVESSVSFNLSGLYVEVLTLTGSGNINATGNNQANTLIGNAGNNVLKGGAKADTMIGGLGDDRYLVDHARDTVTEHKNEGTDTVESSVSFNLSGQYVEVLTLTGSGNINATGNNQANTLIGNAGNNLLKGGGDADTMIGGAGNDRYLVDHAGDTVTELKNEGTDTVESSVSFNLSGQYVEVLTLTGSANVNATGNNQANTLIGNAGNNVLKGGGDADIMRGGAGDDRYVVDNAGDKVTELKDEGTDTVESSVSFNLSGQYVEVLTLTGSANINATGNNQANTLIGNAGNNVLKGGGGNDMLTGGGGSDSFKFGSALGAGNIDTITDYSVPEDQILLDDAVFTGLPVGVLSSAAFHTGAAAADASDRIIYNNATGALLFDADGVGGAAAVQFATLTAGLAMTNSEFLVI